MRKLKKLLIPIILLLSMIFLSVAVYAETGDPNIDNGGGGMGDGSGQNFWNPGNDGVRITVVDSKTGRSSSVSIDYTNKNMDTIQFHFGKNSKADYLGGSELSLNTGQYHYVKPIQSLPAIISDSGGTNIEAIRSYFTDEQVIKGIANDVNMQFNDLINGDYKLMIEPIMYVTYNGAKFAMTATETALYDQKTSGDIRKKFADLSHKNLPLAMFLEKNDLGYLAWTGATNARVSNSDIINYLGIGIVSFKEDEEEPEVHACDYEYRVDTDVITSVTVKGGEHTPDNPVTVTFKIKGKSYQVLNVVYPDGDSQLVWVKWHTPKTEQSVTINVTVEGGATASNSVIQANIVDLDKNPPPNPTAYDTNSSFTIPSVPSKEEVTDLSWGVWSAWWKENWVWVSDWEWHSHTNADGTTSGDWVDNGSWEDHGEWVFEWTGYQAKISADMNITPDEKSPTASGSTMKSGYGINENIVAKCSSNAVSCMITDVQNAVTYFPEFNYQTYWRLLDETSLGTFEFKKNEYSTYNRRTHFTPIWYPNGEYKAYTWVLDCWTPAGMLSLNKTDSVTIKGNVWDDWHMAAAQ